MDVTKFKIPEHWPADARSFVREAIDEIHILKAALKQAVADILEMKGSVEQLQKENRELKAKLGVNSSNSSLPPSKDPPGALPPKTKPTGRKQGAQKGHKGAGRKLFPLERIDDSKDVFPTQCPISKKPLSREELISLSFKRVHQADLPKDARLFVTEFRLHTCSCTCGCGKTVTAVMPLEAGNTAR